MSFCGRQRCGRGTTRTRERVEHSCFRVVAMSQNERFNWTTRSGSSRNDGTQRHLLVSLWSNAEGRLERSDKTEELNRRQLERERAGLSECKGLRDSKCPLKMTNHIFVNDHSSMLPAGMWTFNVDSSTTETTPSHSVCFVLDAF